MHGSMVQWYDSRFGCERPRVRIPVQPVKVQFRSRPFHEANRTRTPNNVPHNRPCIPWQHETRVQHFRQQMCGEAMGSVVLENTLIGYMSEAAFIRISFRIAMFRERLRRLIMNRRGVILEIFKKWSPFGRLKCKKKQNSKGEVSLLWSEKKFRGGLERETKFPRGFDVEVKIPRGLTRSTEGISKRHGK